MHKRQEPDTRFQQEREQIGQFRLRYAALSQQIVALTEQYRRVSGSAAGRLTAQGEWETALRSLTATLHDLEAEVCRRETDLWREQAKRVAHKRRSSRQAVEWVLLLLSLLLLYFLLK